MHGVVPADGSRDIAADTVVLSWPKVPQAVIYKVYVGKSANELTLVGKVQKNSHESDTLEVFTDYYWQITAHKAGDEERILSKSPIWQFKTAQKAFPSAEGFGKFTPGGRGGKVIKVTNLNDSGPGSLREAINTKGPRIIVFDVSGTIMLKSFLYINEPYVTIAGQTAPGDGIAIVGHESGIHTHDVIIRYMRFRGTDLAGITIDSLNNGMPDNPGTRFIIDHCSTSWGIDETLSACKRSVCTVQWSLVSESLRMSVHRKGAHGYGGIWGGVKGSFHHNLLAHHSSRNPRFDGGVGGIRCLIDYRNNVIYNWGFNSCYGAEDDRVNIVNNYYKAGPATKKSCSNRIFQATDPNTRIYVNGNYVNGFEEITKDNWAGGIHFKEGSTATVKTLRVDRPFDVAAVPTTSAEQAYKDVLAKVGAVFPKRDSLDERIVNEVRTGTAKYGKLGDGIIDSQFDLCPQKGKCPECSDGDDDYCWLPKLESKAAPKDTDNDGMPNSWETKNGLNPTNASDAGKDRDTDGFTNIEEYINSLANESGVAGGTSGVIAR
jgi:hypothetical protein